MVQINHPHAPSAIFETGTLTEAACWANVRRNGPVIRRQSTAQVQRVTGL